MLDEVDARGRRRAAGSIDALDRGDRLMGFGHRVYRAEDPRARVLRRTARELGSPRVEVAEALEEAALDELRARHPDRVLATNVEFWSAVVLDFAEVPAVALHADVRLRAHRRLVGARARAEARGAPDPSERALRRRTRPQRGGGRVAPGRPCAGRWTRAHTPRAEIYEAFLAIGSRLVWYPRLDKSLGFELL